ncbi:MAG: 50S ribosomal protein L23 [Clostridiales bacterium]|nr:50S ribosomal protein L23 [Clostridiales bacterium]
MQSPYDIIIAPILSEKSYDQIAGKTYTFKVARGANKVEIRKAVEEIFGVTVASVHTVNKQGKMKRQGRTEGRTPATKKAYVKLTANSKGIELFDGIAQ